MRNSNICPDCGGTILKEKGGQPYCSICERVFPEKKKGKKEP